MKTTPLRFSLALLVTATALSGCNWDSSLYETYGRGNVVTQCPPGKLVPATETDKKSYVELKTMRCYAGRVELIGEKGETAALTRNEEDGSWQGLSCVDQNQNCLSSEGGACNRCADYIDDYRICLALQDFTDIFENGNEKMPSISFIGDFGSTNNIVYDYPDAGKYRICPSDYGKCYYHKEDKRSTSPGEFGCVSSCPSTMVECGGQCIDPKTNTAFCGASENCAGANAGEACADGLSCVNGQCTLVCTKEQVICSEPMLNESTGEVLKDETTGDVLFTNRCVDLQKDDDHCGECKHKCAPGLNCIDGKCVLECLEGMIKCPNDVNMLNQIESLAETDKQCINPLKNNDFCGATAGCENSRKCINGQKCLGACTCTDGKQWCGNQDDGACVDLNNSNEHCGACNVPCTSDADSVRRCIAGKCTVIQCNSGYEYCKLEDNSTKCVNVNSDDENNCGACGYACSEHPLSHATSTVCQNGVCTYTCNDDNLTNCGNTYAPNCVNLKTNAEHCNECDNKCPDKYYCDNGECKPSVCQENECLIKGTCINTTVTCGINCDDCSSKTGVSKSECVSGECNAKVCLPNYHKSLSTTGRMECVENSLDKCGKPDSDIIDNCLEKLESIDPEQGNVDRYHVSCISGECTIECAIGFYKSVSGQCVPDDETNCRGANCLEDYPNISSATCSEDGVCQILECLNGFHKKNNADGSVSCEENTSEVCGKGNSTEIMNCNTFFANSAETECYNGECKLVSCSAGYHLKGNETQSECEKNTNQLCGKVNSFLTYDCTIISNSNKTCNNSGSCSCKNGYTLKLNSFDGTPYCVTEMYCGNTACHNSNGWLNGNCSYGGDCRAKKCQKGYYLESNQCFENTDDACGLSGYSGYTVSCKQLGSDIHCDNEYGLCKNNTNTYYCTTPGSDDFIWTTLDKCDY